MSEEHEALALIQDTIQKAIDKHMAIDLSLHKSGDVLKLSLHVADGTTVWASLSTDEGIKLDDGKAVAQ